MFTPNRCGLAHHTYDEVKKTPRVCLCSLLDPHKIPVSVSACLHPPLSLSMQLGRKRLGVVSCINLWLHLVCSVTFLFMRS